MKSLITTILLLLSPVVPLLLIVGLAISLDTLFGIYKAKKLGIFSSKRLGDALGKIGLYQSIIIILFLMDVYIFNDLTIKYISLPFLITKVMAIFLVYIEFESISETYKELYGISLKEKISTTFGSLRDVLNKFRDLSKRK